jgi:uncharacterized OB-fold protein
VSDQRILTDDGFLLPLRDEDGAGFWEGTLQGELRIQACASCERLRHPPRPMCPHCRSTESMWRTVSGRGTVWSFVVSHPPLLEAYQAVSPYNVILVAIDEDPTIRLVGNLVAGEDGAINEVDPGTIRIGEPVRVVFPRIDEDVALPRWVRAED